MRLGVMPRRMLHTNTNLSGSVQTAQKPEEKLVCICAVNKCPPKMDYFC